MRCFVIGDIHGCLGELTCLMENLPLTPADRVVFLGDYIDRGPDSKGVVSYLLGAAKNIDSEFIFLKGNHEDMLLSYLGFDGSHGDVFLVNGGNATLASYGVHPRQLSREHVRDRIAQDHLEFYFGLQSYYVHSGFLCVHAGIQPQKSLNAQNPLDMLWIRNEFISQPHKLPNTIIFGHTPQREVLFDLPWKIGIDTGVVYGNKLSCIELEEKTLFQVERGARRVRQTSIKKKWKHLP